MYVTSGSETSRETRRDEMSNLGSNGKMWYRKKEKFSLIW